MLPDLKDLAIGNSPLHTQTDSVLARFRSASAAWLILLSGLLIFSPLLEGGTTHLAVMLIRLLILLLLSLYLTKAIRAGTVVVPSIRVAPAILVYLCLASFSTAISPYTNQSRQWLVVLSSYAGLLYLLVSFIVGWDHVAKLLVVLTGLGLCEAGWALLQAWWLGAARPTGTFFNPNFLAGYLAAVWAIVLGYLCYARVGQGGILRAGSLRLIVPIGILGTFLLTVVYTGSRGGVLALAVGTSVVIGVRYGRRALAVFLLLLVVGLLVPNPLRDRLWAEHVVNPVGYARWQIWQSSIHMMAEQPLGIGLGLYQYGYPRYAFPVDGQIARYGKIAHSAHNEYLQMGVELGVASILVFCWGVVMVAREAASVLKLRIRRWQRGVVVGTSGAIAGILAHAGVDSNLHEPALAILLTLCVGLIMSARRLSGQVVEPLRTVPVRFRMVWSAVAVAMIGMLMAATLKLGLAWMAFESGSRAATRQDFAKAIADYRTAITLDSGKALYHNSLAASYFQLFERRRDDAAAQAAVAELQAALALNPLDGRLYGLLGHVYRSLSSSATSSEPLEELKSDQRIAWLHAARSAYERAADLEPFNPFYRLELGRLAMGLGDPELGETHVRRAVEIEPNFLPGRQWLAQLYLDSQRIEEATREYQEIIERQHRYAGWNKDSHEERFLKADATALDVELKRIRPPT
ncbi:MAG: hypothetical protein E6K63_10515 [Nitrospirae bacterium]|nr:MAG: hypothetical protein E6K63_10515 [Nitrospirota bacterium]